MDIRALAYAGFEVSDLDGWASFAVEFLGLPIDRPNGTGDRLLIRMDERSHRFDLRSGTADRLVWLGWEVASSEDLDRAEQELMASGVDVTRGLTSEAAERRVIDFIWFADPAGNRHEIFFGQEADLRPLVHTRSMSGYVTGELGMGHAVLGVDNWAECTTFFTKVLGLGLTDTVRNFMAFLHCNPRHHSLAVVGNKGVGLRHIMLETQALDDVGTALDIAQKRGILTRTLGRHTNDRAVSFYVQTPSGWEIEYGWNGLEIDVDHWKVRQIAGPTSLWGHELVAADARIAKATA